ncbi:MAG: protein-L-isoaspartate(D-aspartate) O-methyltransferase [Gammaproteobacteria bacterium]|nr:protein-L-isoaspartate(D-aspartate) O-methyltransferase [Gammaproteobacteria bacterium]
MSHTPRSSALLLATFATLVACGAPAGPEADARFAQQRDALVRSIERHVQDTRDYLGRAELSARTIAALETTPRHEFVPESLRRYAYDDRPLPIGHDQTISQPYIVAIMTDLLDLQPGCRVLDIGTGSGYQAAVLAEMCEHVYTIEIVEPLGVAARERLARLGYDNVTVRIGDGFDGWPDEAPFDGIVVAAVADELPPPLLEQLRPGGRIIMPVGDPMGYQELILGERRADGSLAETRVLPVRFVPLTRDPDRQNP